jgi:hypothetical protein
MMLSWPRRLLTVSSETFDTVSNSVAWAWRKACRVGDFLMLRCLANSVPASLLAHPGDPCLDDVGGDLGDRHTSERAEADAVLQEDDRGPHVPVEQPPVVGELAGFGAVGRERQVRLDHRGEGGRLLGALLLRLGGRELQAPAPLRVALGTALPRGFDEGLEALGDPEGVAGFAVTAAAAGAADDPGDAVGRTSACAGSLLDRCHVYLPVSEGEHHRHRGRVSRSWPGPFPHGSPMILICEGPLT